MNYQKLYNNIITNAQSKNRKKSKLEYFENHHILPRCLGGSNDKSNLVLLTFKEHYIAHHLLVKNSNNIIHKSKLAMAFNILMNTSKDKLNECDNFITIKVWKFNLQFIRHLESSKLKISAANKDKIISYQHKNILSVIKSGKLNPCNKGEYITPFGHFYGSTEAEYVSGINSKTISNWCINNNKIISNRNITQSYYLKSLSPSPLGKTFKEIGFSFIDLQGVNNKYDNRQPKQPYTMSTESRLKMSKAHKGKIVSKESRERMSKSHIGDKNWQVSGYYQTPFGKFSSSTEASNKCDNIIHSRTIVNFCNHNNNKIITRRSITRSKYLQSLTSSPLGKTYNDIGFSFIKTKNNPIKRKTNSLYITPWGTFNSTKSAVNYSKGLINSPTSISSWCKKNNNKIITIRSFQQSPFLKSLPVSPIGKTFKQVGFYFASV